MSWSRESLGDDHEGWFAAVLPDGFGVAYQGTRIGVRLTDALGRTLAGSELVWREASEVIGWVTVCECGWRGMPVRRAFDPIEAITSQRRFAADDYGDPVDWMNRPVNVEEQLGHPEWAAHCDFVERVGVGEPSSL